MSKFTPRRVFLAVGLLITFLLGRGLQAPSARPGVVRARGSAHVVANHPMSTSAVDEALVTRAIDGDTVELENGERVRYVGMDTPETKDRRKPVQCFGKAAAARNKELVEGKMVRLVRDVSDRDRYGRLLRYIYVGDLFVNLTLVEEGFARNYSYPPDISHQAEFRAAERAAREAKRGLWAECVTNK